MENSMDDKEFYDRCADILDAEHEYLPFAHYARTRWNNRKPGSGRFPGRGIIRIFGNDVHIAISSPIPIHQRVRGKQEALDLLERLIEGHRRTQT